MTPGVISHTRRRLQDVEHNKPSQSTTAYDEETAAHFLCQQIVQKISAVIFHVHGNLQKRISPIAQLSILFYGITKKDHKTIHYC